MATQDPAPLGPQPFEQPTPQAQQALAQVLGLAKPAPLTQPQTPPAQPQQPPAPEVQTNVISGEKVVTPVQEPPAAKPAEATPPASTEPPAPPAPSAIDSLFEAPQTKEVPSELATFLKEQHNIQDLASHLKEFSTIKEQLALVQQDAATSRAIIDHINSMSPEMLRAIEEDRKKPGSGVDFLRSLPKADYSRPGSEQDKFALVENRYPGKFSEEEKAEIRSGVAEDALKRQFERYHELAVMDHDADRARWQADRQKEIDFRTQHNKKWEESAAAAYAHLDQKAKSLSMDLTPEIRKQHESGVLYTNLFYTKDGFLKPEALETALTIKRLPDILDRVKKAAEVKGKNEGIAEAHMRLPTQPRPTGSEQVPNNNQQRSPEQLILDRILTGK